MGNSEEDTLSKEEIYLYDNLSHLQPTRIVRESDNKRITEYSSFPLDYSEVTGPIGDLKQAHVVSAPIEKVVWQENLDGSETKILSGELLVYAPGGKGLVQEFRQLETASPIDLSGFKIDGLGISLIFF